MSKNRISGDGDGWIDDHAATFDAVRRDCAAITSRALDRARMAAHADLSSPARTTPWVQRRHTAWAVTVGLAACFVLIWAVGLSGPEVDPAVSQANPSTGSLVLANSVDSVAVLVSRDAPSSFADSIAAAPVGGILDVRAESLADRLRIEKQVRLVASAGPVRLGGAAAL